MSKPASTLHEILNRRSTGLAGILSHVRDLQKADEVLGHILPGTLAAHTTIANVRGQVLILNADSSAWATRLRYQRDMLIWRLQSELGMEIRKVQIRVIPPTQPHFSAVLKRRPRGATRRHLLQAARLEEDPGLAAALRRLAGPEEPPEEEAAD